MSLFNEGSVYPSERRLKSSSSAAMLKEKSLLSIYKFEAPKQQRSLHHSSSVDSKSSDSRLYRREASSSSLPISLNLDRQVMDCRRPPEEFYNIEVHQRLLHSPLRSPPGNKRSSPPGPPPAPLSPKSQSIDLHSLFGASSHQLRQMPLHARFGTSQRASPGAAALRHSQSSHVFTLTSASLAPDALLASDASSGRHQHSSAKHHRETREETNAQRSRHTFTSRQERSERGISNHASHVPLRQGHSPLSAQPLDHRDSEV